MPVAVQRRAVVYRIRPCLSHSPAAGARPPALLLGCCLLLLAACSTPVGVTRADPRTVHRGLTSNVLSSGRLSGPTQNVLFEQDLVESFGADPEKALARLRAVVVAGEARRSDIFALAELSFQHAEDTGKRAYFLASAVYAYAFLFPGSGHHAPDAFDSRFRVACDLYNRGVAAGFASEDGSEVDLHAGDFPLPFGTLQVDFDAAQLQKDNRQLTHLIPVAELEVHGMETRYRWPGIGAPLAASTEPIDPALGFQDLVIPWSKVAVTALLRIDNPRQQIVTDRVHATLTIESPSQREQVDVDGQPAPIEIESTATLAYMMAESPVWQQEIAGFLKGVGVIDEKTRLAMLAPYRPGKIPVVLVHGTASSSGRWAQMLNELFNDRRIREHYQFWLFTYNTGNPIGYSAMLLRESLTNALRRVDPGGTDPALQRMVVIGHSQGGLLTKMTVIESSDRFWNDMSKKPFEQVDLSEQERDILRRTMFVHPSPFVRRVVFIATPQRGSYFAGSRLAHWAARFITLPMDMVHVSTDFVLRNKQAVAFADMGELPTAVDNMTPGNRFIKTLASIPVAPGVAAHSIIAVDGDGPAEAGNDGIVEYQSAHIDGVESELVVRSGHSCQANPHTIEEVRRILLEHLETN